MQKRILLSLTLLAAAMAAPTLASAQAVAPTTPPATPGSPQTIPEKQAPGAETNLSDKLDATDGVIKPPPSGDADMTIAPPNSGSRTPVIPPSAVPPSGAPADGAKPEAK